jgi:hypothetical protein
MPNSRHNSLNTPWLLQPKDWRGEHHPKWFTSWGYDKRRNNEKTHSFWCRWDPICVYSESFLMFICLSQTMMRCLGILDVCPNFAKKQPNNQLLLHWGHLIRSPVPLSALLPPLLGSFLLPVICAQSLKIAVRSFPLIMYLGLKSIMILKILISIINLYIYISGSCFQYHGVSTPVSKVWLKNAPDPFSAQLWWQHWATRLWCDGFMSRCYNEWLNSIDSIDTLSWCKSNANI